MFKNNFQWPVVLLVENVFGILGSNRRSFESSVFLWNKVKVRPYLEFALYRMESSDNALAVLVGIWIKGLA